MAARRLSGRASWGALLLACFGLAGAVPLAEFGREAGDSLMSALPATPTHASGQSAVVATLVAVLQGDVPRGGASTMPVLALLLSSADHTNLGEQAKGVARDALRALLPAAVDKMADGDGDGAEEGWTMRDCGQLADLAADAVRRVADLGFDADGAALKYCQRLRNEFEAGISGGMAGPLGELVDLVGDYHASHGCRKALMAVGAGADFEHLRIRAEGAHERFVRREAAEEALEEAIVQPAAVRALRGALAQAESLMTAEQLAPYRQELERREVQFADLSGRARDAASAVLEKTEECTMEDTEALRLVEVQARRDALSSNDDEAWTMVKRATRACLDRDEWWSKRRRGEL